MVLSGSWVVCVGSAVMLPLSVVVAMMQPRFLSI